MISFKEFLEESAYDDELILITEGGNVQIGDEEAQRIDLRQFKRGEVVSEVTSLLSTINDLFKKQHGLPLWNKSLFDSKKFLSGSAYHFFDTSSIKDEDFVNVKSTVGDIDTQVDVNAKPMIKDFLDSIIGRHIGPAIFVGYKASGEQFITLWTFPKFGINIQTDLEMVEFDKKGFPTAWSQFSHSSAWEDISKGIKGVAHKMLMQSLDAPKFKNMIIKAKTSRGTDKILNRGTHAFSVSHGVREKMVPVLDSKGNVLYQDTTPIYKELSTKESFGNTDLFYIFNHFFGVEPSSAEIEQMSSFVGTIQLIKKYFNKTDWSKIVDEFTNKFWAPGAQGIYRGNPQLDLDEKTHAVRYIAKELGVDMKRYDDKIATYYKSYK